MKLYGRRLSPFVERVCLQIAYKGLEDEVVLTPIPGEDLRSAEYLAISPLGKMPLLEDGDLCLPESAVISEYIEERFPDKPTLPGDPVGRARARLVVRCLDLYVLAPLFYLIGQLRVAERDEAMMAEKLAETVKGLDLLEGLIDQTGHMVGQDWTQADFAAIPAFFIMTRYLANLGAEPFAGRPKLEAWFETCSASDLFKNSEAAQEEALAEFLERMQAEREAQAKAEEKAKDAAQ